jgi:hypothetical protein
MRSTAVALALVLSACGTTVGAGSNRPSATATATSPTASPSPTATPRVTTATSHDCTVSWADHFTTVGQIASKAELIVRAVAISTDTVHLKAFGAGNAVSLRDARRTTFRVVETRKGSTTAEIRVLEDVCPNLEVRPGQEWLLFASRWDPKYGPESGGEHFFTQGGPQGQVRFTSGKVSGPFFRFAELVHAYEGASIDEVLRDVRAAVR